MKQSYYSKFITYICNTDEQDYFYVSMQTIGALMEQSSTFLSWFSFKYVNNPLSTTITSLLDGQARFAAPSVQRRRTAWLARCISWRFGSERSWMSYVIRFNSTGSCKKVDAPSQRAMRAATWMGRSSRAVDVPSTCIPYVAAADFDLLPAPSL